MEIENAVRIMTAGEILEEAAKDITAKAKHRDTDAERSMAKTVNAFNTIFNHHLSETEGWQFMVILKMVRGNQGDFHMDDYMDQASYSGLAGECEQGASCI